jgi:hypothetical protein
MCLVDLQKQEDKRASGAFFLPVSARVKLTFYIFRPILCLCKTATSSGQKIIKFSRKKAKSLDYLVEFHIVWLQLGSCSTISHIVPEEVRSMMFSATFNTMSVIMWWSVLSLEETGVPQKNHRPV